MKIRSLLVGSVAAAGLSTGAYAADLGVLTSLDICDELGISGLTISSDTNCLQITGSVSYEFVWGDYEFDDNGDGPGDGSTAPVGSAFAVTGAGTRRIAISDGDMDWASKVEAWIKFVATANSDFGPAKAVIKIKDVQQIDGWGFSGAGNVIKGGDDTTGPIFDEAYVAIGDSTVFIAGKAGSIMNKKNDEPLNWLGLFNSDAVDKGVAWNVSLPDGGHVLQVTSDLGNGVSIKGGLEALNNLNTTAAGTAVGVIEYAGDGISAHATFAAGGFLDGVVENWGVHAGLSGEFDMFKFVAAIAGDNSGYWNGLGSASATFDIFTLAVSGEFVQNNATSGNGDGGTDFGAGGSIGAAVTDGVSINAGSRFYVDAGGGNASWQSAVNVVASVTETLTLTGEVGWYANTGTTDPFDVGPQSVFYGAAELAWAPGGGFTASGKGEVYSNGAYKATVKAAKTFE
jgi:hypothetical protein